MAVKLDDTSVKRLMDSPFDAGLILDRAEDLPSAACELSADIGFHSNISWR
jgi:hypothetical protein